MMTELEKVEKLRERANVTYEEAKTALDEAGGDLLDAIVILERQGKTRRPEKSVYSTSYEDQEDYVKVKDKVYQQQTGPRVGQTLGKVIRKAWRMIRTNSIQVMKGDQTIVVLPCVVFFLLLLFFWKLVIPVMIIGLFFGFRYSFFGTNEMDKANEFMEKAGDIAEDVKKEFRK